MAGDVGDFETVNHFARDTTWLHGFMAGYATTYGLVVFALLLVIGWWLARRDASLRRVALVGWTVIGTLVALELGQIVSHDVGEARPFVALPHTLTLVKHAADPGFPSDHAIMAGAVAAGLLLVDRRVGLVALVAGLLLSFSRVYVGVHYPHDVVVGMLLGAATVLVGAAVLARPLTWLVELLARTPLRPLALPARRTI